MQRHKRAHSFTHVLAALILSVETRKLPRRAEISQKFIHFSSAGFFGRASACDESRAKVWTVTSRWVVNLPSSHHSFLPLVNRIKCSAWPQDGCQDIFWTEYQLEAVASKTCYVNVSRGHRNVLRGELELASLVWCLRQSQRAPRGVGICDFPWMKHREEEKCWFTLRLKEQHLAGMRGVLLHLHPGWSVST